MPNAPARDTPFTPRLSASDAKREAIYNAAQEIIDKEAAARDAKIARLREARMKQEAEQSSAPRKAASHRATAAGAAA
ncbi:hypothetical protein MWN34_12975 [Ancylobacter sp. 6x-1]|uniref:Uncharacterized protein n=1 Tax=Ancylobacter crimeensis TaxID=2579147 RepID=A0ABT0DDJ3_9HYPH|nr:hypothetical protein [Ancylobacter crimeensis]MCK0197822.1 hypothetical protein [Ancylobacter crimeensis]